MNFWRILEWFFENVPGVIWKISGGISKGIPETSSAESFGKISEEIFECFYWNSLGKFL